MRLSTRYWEPLDSTLKKSMPNVLWGEWQGKEQEECFRGEGRLGLMRLSIWEPLDSTVKKLMANVLWGWWQGVANGKSAVAGRVCRSALRGLPMC